MVTMVTNGYKQAGTWTRKPLQSTIEDGSEANGEPSPPGGDTGPG